MRASQVRIAKVEATQEQALQGWLGKLKAVKQNLKEATENSTASLNKVASLFERQHALEATAFSSWPISTAPLLSSSTLGSAGSAMGSARKMYFIVY